MKSHDTDLRERLLKEYKSSEAISLPNVGSASFAERWLFEVADPAKVDKEYRNAVNEKQIKEAIANGVRAIKGVRIYPDRVLRITPAKK